MTIRTLLSQNIAKQILISFFLFSLILTTLSTVFILSSQYQNDKKNIISNSKTLINNQVNTLSQVLWNMDKALAKINLNSLANNENITYISINNESGDLFASSGDESIAFSKVIQIPLYFKNTLSKSTDKIKIGNLKAYISTDSAIQNTINNSISIIAIQVLKSLITSFVFLFLIYWLLVRHIQAITQHILTQPLASLFKLERKYRDDELQFLVDIMNKNRLLRDDNSKRIKQEKLSLKKEIKQRKEAEKKVKTSQEQLLYVLNSLTNSVFLCRSNGEIIFMNNMALKLLNHHDAICSTTDESLFIHEAITLTETNDINSKKITLNLNEYNTKFVSKLNAYHIPPSNTDSLTPVSIDLIPAKISDQDDQTGYIILLSDQSSQKKLKKMSYIATHDYLTKLYNRLHITKELEKLTKDNSEGYSLAIIDLDKFKNVNDTCGHRAGDELLKLVANTMKASLEPNDLLARIGGDEFAILFHSDASKSKNKCLIILSNLEKLNFTYDGHTLPISCSIGITNILSNDTKISNIFARADHACYQVKENGKGDVKIFDQNVIALNGRSPKPR